MNIESTLVELQQVLRKADELISQLLSKDSQNLTPDAKEKAIEKSLKIIATKRLQKYEIPKNLKGYEYLRTAIVLALQDKNLLKDITKGLYGAIAEKHDTTPSRVEKGCRYAIEKSTYGPATNSQFIAEIVDEIGLSDR